MRRKKSKKIPMKRSMGGPFVILFSVVGLLLPWTAYAAGAGGGPQYTFDAALQAARQASAANFETPSVDRLLVGNQVVWTRGQTTPARLTAGQWVTVQGSGFGGG